MIFLHVYGLSQDNCKKLGLVFENVVGIVEIINSKAIQLQVRKTLTELLYVAFKRNIIIVISGQLSMLYIQYSRS